MFYMDDLSLYIILMPIKMYVCALVYLTTPLLMEIMLFPTFQHQQHLDEHLCKLCFWNKYLELKLLSQWVYKCLIPLLYSSPLTNPLYQKSL